MAKRPGLTLEKIVDAALELAQRNGETAVTLGALAKHFGVKPPSLYNHVKNLAELKREMRLRGLLALHQRLQDACMGLAGRDALFALCQAYRSFGREQPALYQMTLAATEMDDDALYQAGRKLLTLIFAVLQAYQLEDEELIHATRCLRSALHGFVSLENSQGFAMPTDLDVSYTHLIQHLDSMLTHWQPTNG